MARATGVKYTVILQPETDPEFAGYYNAMVPALPGCNSYGASRDEALDNIKEAIVAWLWAEDQKAMAALLPEARQPEIVVSL